MSERDAYAPGTPSWVDLATSDLEAAKAFYKGVFDWDWGPAGPPEQTGGYGFFTLGGKLVAGGAPIMTEGHPPAWSTYVSVDDAHATAAQAAELGGTTIVEPMVVGPAGTMAFFADPSGAAFGVWQPDQHKGAQLVNEPGALTWNELQTRDPDACTAFYGGLFGWAAADGPMPGYTEWELDGADIAGMIVMSEMFPPDLPANWLTYFAVADTDATTAAIGEGGGSVIVPPTDLPVGRFAVAHDPQGAVFAVIALAQAGA